VLCDDCSAEMSLSEAKISSYKKSIFVFGEQYSVNTDGLCCSCSLKKINAKIKEKKLKHMNRNKNT